MRGWGQEAGGGRGGVSGRGAHGQAPAAGASASLASSLLARTLPSLPVFGPLRAHTHTALPIDAGSSLRGAAAGVATNGWTGRGEAAATAGASLARSGLPCTGRACHSHPHPAHTRPLSGSRGAVEWLKHRLLSGQSFVLHRATHGIPRAAPPSRRSPACAVGAACEPPAPHGTRAPTVA